MSYIVPAGETWGCSDLDQVMRQPTPCTNCGQQMAEHGDHLCIRCRGWFEGLALLLINMGVRALARNARLMSVFSREFLATRGQSGGPCWLPEHMRPVEMVEMELEVVDD